MEIRFKMYKDIPESYTFLLFRYWLPPVIVLTVVILLFNYLTTLESQILITLNTSLLALFAIPVWLHICCHNRIREPKNLDGELVFTESSLTIKGESIDLETISRISFELKDYYGEREFLPGGGFLSNGHKNWMTLGDFQNRTKTFQFQRRFESELKYLEPFLLNMHAKGKISFLHLAEIIEADSDSKMNALREKIKKTTPNNG